MSRGLLVPCIALTAAVQRGNGKYRDTAGAAAATSEDKDAKDKENNEHKDGKEDVTSISVDVDACMFDRVLLFLEHQCR